MGKSYKGGLNIVRSTLNCKMEQTVAVEKSGQCIQTAEPYIEPPNDVDIEMAISKLKNGKATGKIKFWPN